MHEFCDKPLRVPGESPAVHYRRLIVWLINLRVVPRRHEARSGPATFLYRSFIYDGLTRPGKALLLAGIMVYFSSYWFPAGYHLSIAAIAVSFLFVAAGASFVYRPRITLRRNTPWTAVAGETSLSRITVSNTGKRPLYNFCAREMDGPDFLRHREYEFVHHSVLQSGGEITVPVPFTPRRRGIAELHGISVQSYFPFFLTRFCKKIQSPATVYIMPPSLNASLPPLRHLAEQSVDRKTAGLKRGRAIDSHEYAYSRQFQTGDSTRRLDQRASGRRGEPMSKVFEGTSLNTFDRLYVIVDTSLKSFMPWQPRPVSTHVLDRRLALVLELFHKARNESLCIDSVALDGKWAPVPTDRSLYQQIASCSACRAPCLPRHLPDPGGLYAMVLGTWKPEMHSAVRAWMRGGAIVLVFLMPETANDIGTLPQGKNFIEVRE